MNGIFYFPSYKLQFQVIKINKRKMSLIQAFSKQLSMVQWF